MDEKIKELEEYLNQEYSLLEIYGDKSPESIYYKGVLKGVELLGFTWQRDKNGIHKITQ